MEDWSANFWAMLETVTGEMELFFQEVSEEFELMVEDFSQQVASDIDYLWRDLFEPIDDTPEIEEIRPERESNYTPIIDKFESRATHNPACTGCHHYHGQFYGENFLVCAMHPYGWDDQHCPDWQGDKI